MAKNKSTERPKPLVLAILDGFGVAPPSDGNAISMANTPNIDKFVKEFPVMTLYAAGKEVGLMYGEMGNSEVGHLNIGAGRIYYQTLPRIFKSIEDKSFFENEQFTKAVEHTKKNKSKLHIMGLVSPGNIHASQDHLDALLDFCKEEKVKEVYIHAFIDGRDTGEKTAKDFIKKLQEKIKEVKRGKIATVSGRYYAMDRDNRWDRTELAYNAMVKGESTDYFTDPLKAIDASYKKKVYDEQFVPVVIGVEGKPTTKIESGDACIFFNFRPDRARQITEAFIGSEFKEFAREQVKDLFFVTMTEFEKDLSANVAYPPVVISNCFAEVLSNAGLKQYHVAETEKYAHVTFFLNGTIEDPFNGEDRKIIPSPKVASYDKAPEMSAPEITKNVIKAVESDKYDVIILNYANTDMVCHTGILEAGIKGVEAVDKGLGEIADHVLAKDGVLLVTADHGNGEEMINLQTNESVKEHSTNPVPFFIISNSLKGQAGPAGDPPNGDLGLLNPVGMLADVAPTALKLLGVEQPKDMGGRALM